MVNGPSLRRREVWNREIMRVPNKVSMADRKARVTQNVPLGHI